MTLRNINDGSIEIRFNDVTKKLHYVSINAAREVTDLGAVIQDTGTTSTLTFSRVVITQGAAGYHSLLVGETNKICRLHALVGTMSAAGTLVIQSSTDIAAPDTGAGLVALSGTMNLPANGGIVLPFISEADKVGCLSCTSLSLGFTSATGFFNGYAIVSKE